MLTGPTRYFAPPAGKIKYKKYLIEDTSGPRWRRKVYLGVRVRLVY